MVLAMLLAVSSVAFSQAALDGIITGRVEDTSGARIPGVTISVTSPAIQGERTQVTDESGAYRFPNLPPGTYRVRYELPGFKTLIREGILVDVAKTNTMNVQLEVATVAETVTVSGESPVVDVEQASIGVNFASQLKDNIVNSRDYWALLSVTPGVMTTTPDVGGTTMGTQVGYRSYGLSGQVKVYLDGVDLTEGNNGGSMYGDYGSWEEVNVSSAANGAEMQTAGSSISAVVRSGTNSFHGTVLADVEPPKVQAANLTSTLTNQGITAGDAFNMYHDLNLDLGGPIKHDKLWFYNSFRREYSALNTNMRQSGGVKYVLPASGIAPNLCGAGELPCPNGSVYSPDGAPQGGLFYTRLTNYTIKMNYQLNPDNQLITSANVRLKFQPYRNGSGSNEIYYTPESTYQQQSWFHIWKAQWTSTLSSKTTLDVSLNDFGYYWRDFPNDSGPRIHDVGTSGPTRSYYQGGDQEDLMNRRRWNDTVVLSHFTNGLGGSHNTKFGYILQWEDFRYSNAGYAGGPISSGIPNLYFLFNNGAPYQIQVSNVPTQWQQQTLLSNTFYVQDKWQIGRKLTLNLGLRFDRYTNFAPEQVRESAGASPWDSATDILGLETFGNATFPKTTAAIFNNAVPRLAFVYDAFGNGRTAIKGSFGRFSYNPADTLAGFANLNAPPGGAGSPRSATYTWDGTLPFTPAYLRSCLASGKCTNVSRPNLTFPALSANLQNSFTNEYTGGLDQQIAKDWNLRVNYVRKINIGAWGQIDSAFLPTDYTPFQFRDPGRDGVIGTADDQIVTVYNRAAGSRASQPVVAYNPGGGDMYRTLEVEGVKRYANKWQTIVGADWTKRDLAPPVFTTDPNQIFNPVGAGHYWQWTGKFVFQYDLPYGIKANTVIKTQKGETQTGSGTSIGGSRTVQINCDRLVPVGQTCAQAGGKTPNQGTFNLAVEPNGSDSSFYPTLTLWDARISKQVNLERWGKVEGIFDIYNITNQNTITGWSITSTSTTNQDGSVASTWHRPTGILNPRIARFTVRWSF
jgi:hypothetical protein